MNQLNSAIAIRVFLLIAFLQWVVPSKGQSHDKSSISVQEAVYQDAVVKYNAIGLEIQRGDCTSACVGEASIDMSGKDGKDIVAYIQEHLDQKSMKLQGLTYNFQVFTDTMGIVTNVLVSHMPATPVNIENVLEVTRVVRTIKFKRTSKPENSYGLWIKV